MVYLNKQFLPNSTLMKTHAIHWKSSLTGTIGTGTKLFEKEEAEHLAAELNEDYPDIDHAAVVPEPIPTEAADAKSQKI